MSLFKHLSFYGKVLFCLLLLTLGAGASLAQDIEPGSSVMEAKSRKPPVKAKSAPKSGSTANAKSASKPTKSGNAQRAKTNASPTVRNAKTPPKENDEETNGRLTLEVVVGAAPVYPGAAKQAGASGNVRVEVTVDEKGDVISAQAKDGHELLRSSAETAARSTKFMPRKVNGKAVKTTGFLIYCFGGNCE